MTTTLKQETKNGKYLCIENTINYGCSVYVVSLCNNYGSSVFRIEKQYKNPDKKKAMQAYYRYKKEL